jgi:hypothetical protein
MTIRAATYGACGRVFIIWRGMAGLFDGQAMLALLQDVID